MMRPERENDARRHSRVQLPTEVEISCADLRCFRQPAHLRDVSAGGAFVYAPISPALGMPVKLDFTLQVIGSDIQISCEGSVVRLEPNALGERSGIAVSFSRLDFGA